MNTMTSEEPKDQTGNYAEERLLPFYTLLSISSSRSLVVDLIYMEENLMSLEKLDRASPDLWPEQSEYISRNAML